MSSAGPLDPTPARRRRTFFFGGALVVLAVIVVAGWGGLAGTLLGVHGRIHLRGEIVDADTGRPIEDVQISVRETRFDLFGRDFSSEREWREIVSGEYSASCWSCAGLRVRLTKAGFHSAEREATAAGGEGSGASRVVLHSAANAVPHLLAVRGEVTVGGGTEMVLPLDGTSSGHAVPVSRLLAGGEPDGAATPRLALRAELDAAGRAREGLVSRPGGTTRFRKPVDARLVIEGAPGGFLAYTPRASRFADIQLEMREAPLSGYRPELPLDVVTDQTSWFWIRVGDRFGRGRHQPPSITGRAGGLRASVSVAVDLAPTVGSRNLETLR